MAALKYSKQRASIKDYLAHTTAHPTADTVYLHIKEEFPNISLGTVYRNLNLLADIGEALRDSYIQKVNEEANACFDGIIESHTTLFHGLCAECAKKMNENK